MKNNYSFEKYKEHCLLLPLDFNYEIASFKNTSAKKWKQSFMNKIIDGANKNNPTKSKEEILSEVQNNFFNLMSIVRNNLRDTEPLLSMAYPIANCWIVPFFSDYFNKELKLDSPAKIKEVNYDPIRYAYKISYPSMT